MRSLSETELDLVGGGDVRGLVVSVGRVAGGGAGYVGCLPCGGLGTALATGAGSELGGLAAGYVYDHPGQTLAGALTVFSIADAASSLIGMLRLGDVWGNGEGGSPAGLSSW